MNDNKAIVAIARRLLMTVWHVLTERVTDRRTDPDMIAPKLLAWSWKLTDAQRGGLTSRLKFGQEITRIKHRSNRPIASEEEVLECLLDINLSI
jgi:hypothetical protein